MDLLVYPLNESFLPLKGSGRVKIHSQVAEVRPLGSSGNWQNKFFAVKAWLLFWIVKAQFSNNKFLTMKKTGLTITLIFSFMLAATRLFAQSELKEMPAGQRAKWQTERMTSSLKLDAAQTEKVREINMKYAQKMDPVIQSTGSKMSRFKAFKSINRDKEAELRGVLTTQQFEQFQKQQQEMKDKLREQRH